MRKTLFCGVDLHSNNAMYVITDGRDQQLFKKRLPNELPIVLDGLEPFRARLKIVAVESTYNWYWLVDGLLDHQYPVVLAQPSAMDQYDGIKEADDLTDAAFLARLARLNILPTGYIYPKQDRPVRDLLRRRTLVVQQRTGMILSLQNLAMRQSGRSVGWRDIRRLGASERTALLGDHDCLTFVADQQVALTIMLETGDIARFETVGDYTSYCRCVRATHTSNGKRKSPNNGKNGNAYLAWAFVEAVHHAIRVCPQARRFYDRKRARRNGALATKALAAKWSKAAYYIMKRQEPFDLKRVFG